MKGVEVGADSLGWSEVLDHAGAGFEGFVLEGFRFAFGGVGCWEGIHCWWYWRVSCCNRRQSKLDDFDALKLDWVRFEEQEVKWAPVGDYVSIP